MRIVVVVSGWILALLLGACSPPGPDTALATAQGQLARSEHAQAVLTLKTLLQEYPSLGEARRLLGEALLATGDAAAAQAEFERALEAGEAPADVVPALAKAMNQQGQGARLLAAYGKTVLNVREARAALAVQLAAAHLAAGDVESAERTLKPALEAVPGDVDARLLDVRLVALRERLPEAASRLDALLRGAPENAAAWVLKAQLQQRMGGSADAVKDAYRRALAARPDHVEAHTGLVSVLLANADLDAAGRQLDAMRKALPGNVQATFLDALLADARGDYPRVRELTQRLLNAAPDSPRVLLVAGKAEAALGSLARAEALLNKAVQASPAAPAPRRLLADVYLKQGKPDKAEAALKPLLGGSDAEAIALAAQAALQSGNFAAAAAGFKRAVSLKPEDPRLRTRALVASLGRGNDLQVLAALQALADAEPQAGDIDQALVAARMARQEFDAALKAVDAAAAKSPSLAWPDQVRGRILLQRGDAAGARRHLERALEKAPTHYGTVAQLASLDIADKQPQAAIARFEALLKRDPQQSSAKLAIAELRSRSGAPASEVEALLRAAAAAHPDDPSAQGVLIDFLFNNGGVKAAVAAALKATTALPQDPDLLDRLGRAQLANGELSQAVATFRRLVKLRPEAALPHLRLAQTHQAMDKPDVANSDLRKASELEPRSAEVQRALLAQAMRDRRFADAMTLARELQAHNPADPAGLLMQGDIEAAQQRWEPSEAAYRQALERFPHDGLAAQRLYLALLRGDKRADAERFAKDWLDKHPDNVVFRHYLAGLALANQDWSAAEAAYDELARRRPSDLVAVNNLAVAKVRLKKPDAVATAERAVALAPNRAPSLDTLAGALAAAGQMDKAIEWQLKAVTLAPDAPAMRLKLAQLFQAVGDNDRAQRELGTLARLGDSFDGHEEVKRLHKPDHRPKAAAALPYTPAGAQRWLNAGTAAMAGGAAIGLGLLLLLIAAMRAPLFKAQRSITVDAPAQRVFDLLQDLRAWERWSAWLPFGPAMMRSYPRSSVGWGASCTWRNKRRSAEGSMEIVHFSPPSRVALEMTVSRPVEARQMSDFLVSTDPSGATRVSVVAQGEATFRMRFAYMLRGVDRGMGRALDAELARLKAAAERVPAEAPVAAGTGPVHARG